MGSIAPSLFFPVTARIGLHDFSQSNTVLFVAMAMGQGLGFPLHHMITKQRGIPDGVRLAISILSVGFILIKPTGAEPPPGENRLDLEPALIESSPTLQRWLEQTPDLFEENQRDPAFLPTLRLGYQYAASPNQRSGLAVGLEDWFIGSLPLSFSADYHSDFRGHQAGGGNVQYYLLPLGWYVNVTPLVGYRSIQQGDYHSDGINLGGKVVFALSRSGAADLRFSQMFTAPGSAQEVGTSTLSVGYAFSPHWRLATDLQQQNSKGGKDSQVGLYLEWQP
ncbi:MAG: hypothetical protein VKJ27_01145 [Synechocystis sp.]|nr:hypothetical protein [Synechocystis sp.]